MEQLLLGIKPSGGSFFGYLLKYLSYTRYNLGYEDSGDDAIYIGHIALGSRVARLLGLKLGHGKGGSGAIALNRALLYLRAYPLSLLPSDTVIANIISKPLDTVYDPRYMAMAHLSVQKNLAAIRRDSISAALETRTSELGGDPSAALLATALLSGLTRQGFELHAAAAQNLVAGYILGEVGVDAAAKGITALFIDLVIYYLVNILHYKRGGTLGGELLHSIAVDPIKQLVDKIDEAPSAVRPEELDATKYLERIYSIASSMCSHLLKTLGEIPLIDRDRDPKEVLEKITHLLEELKNELLEIEKTIYKQVLDFLRVKDFQVQDTRTEPLIGRLSILIQRLSDIAGDDCIPVIMLTGQSSGYVVKLLWRMLGREKPLYIAWTPYTLLNLQNTVDILDIMNKKDKNRGKNYYIFPLTHSDLYLNEYMGKQVAKHINRASGNGGKPVCALLQGVSQTVYPFAIGLAENTNGIKIKII